MFDLSPGERNFVNSGGLLWCMRVQPDERWQLFKVFKDEVETFRVRPESFERAIDWIFALAAISSLIYDVNIHHSIFRRSENEKRIFPVIVG